MLNQSHIKVEIDGTEITIRKQGDFYSISSITRLAAAFLAAKEEIYRHLKQRQKQTPDDEDLSQAVEDYELSRAMRLTRSIGGVDPGGEASSQGSAGPTR